MAVCKIQAATAPMIDWVSDSTTSFDVVLSGTGPGWSGTITSPSGLWQLESANVIGCENASQPSSLAFVDNTGLATFEGLLPAQYPAPNPSADPPFNAATIGTYGGYWDTFKPVAPIDDKNGLVYGYLNEYAGWSGISTISITSMPNACDPSTWTWIAQYSASGGNLDPAPEPNTLTLCALVAILGIVRAFQRSRAPGLAHDGRGAGVGARP